VPLLCSKKAQYFEKQATDSRGIVNSVEYETRESLSEHDLVVALMLKEGPMQEWSILRYDPDLKIDFLHAFYTKHAYPVHSHDYYVVCLIERGVQSCVAGRSKDITLPGGIILLNPGEPHSGESASDDGFEYRALYPTCEHMQLVRQGLEGSFHSDLSFDTVRLYDHELEGALRRLHLALHQPASAFERESRFVWVVTRLMQRYMRPVPQQERLKLEPDAIKRAKAYIGAGADGIMIHSRKKTPDEVLKFCDIYNGFNDRVPLVVVPSSYNTITDTELADAGANIVIYANQLLRSAYPAMLETAQSILKYGRSAEVDSKMMSINEVLELIPGTK